MNLICRKARPSDSEALTNYLEQLSVNSRSRFGPHPFDNKTVDLICNKNYKGYRAYICLDMNDIVGYIVVVKGYIEGDRERYSNYSIQYNKETDFTLAPSVADKYQSKGVGTKLYLFVENELIKKGTQKIILWGGVQLSNKKAVRFYQKQKFKVLGEFRHNNMDNLDMVKLLDQQQD